MKIHVYRIKKDKNLFWTKIVVILQGWDLIGELQLRLFNSPLIFKTILIPKISSNCFLGVSDFDCHFILTR